MIRLTSTILFLMWINNSAGITMDPSPCDYTEPCAFEIAGFPVAGFCLCEGNTECPSTKEHQLIFQDVKYRFCEEVRFKECEVGGERPPIAWVRRGLRQYVQCVCPAPNTLISQQWNDQEDITEYICAEKGVCEKDKECSVRRYVERANGKRLSNLRELCSCPEGHKCRQSEEHSDIPDYDGRKKDSFFCV